MKSMCHDARRKDRRVLGGAQGLGVDATGGEVVARGVELGRTQQAADVVGAEGRRGADRHSGSVA
jgi:hypothetical protein